MIKIVYAHILFSTVKLFKVTVMWTLHGFHGFYCLHYLNFEVFKLNTKSDKSVILAHIAFKVGEEHVRHLGNSGIL